MDRSRHSMPANLRDGSHVTGESIYLFYQYLRRRNAFQLFITHLLTNNICLEKEKKEKEMIDIDRCSTISLF